MNEWKTWMSASHKLRGGGTKRKKRRMGSPRHLLPTINPPWWCGADQRSTTLPPAETASPPVMHTPWHVRLPIVHTPWYVPRNKTEPQTGATSSTAAGTGAGPKPTGIQCEAEYKAKGPGTADASAAPEAQPPGSLSCAASSSFDMDALGLQPQSMDSNKHLSFTEVRSFFSGNPIGGLSTLPSAAVGKPQTFVLLQQHDPYLMPPGVHGETSATEGEPKLVRALFSMDRSVMETMDRETKKIFEGPPVRSVGVGRRMDL